MGLFSRKIYEDEEKKKLKDRVAELEASLEEQKQLVQMGDQLHQWFCGIHGACLVRLV